jgi:hypothetical protein
MLDQEKQRQFFSEYPNTPLFAGLTPRLHHKKDSKRSGKL